MTMGLCWVLSSITSTILASRWSMIPILSAHPISSYIISMNTALCSKMGRYGKSSQLSAAYAHTLITYRYCEVYPVIFVFCIITCTNTKNMVLNDFRTVPQSFQKHPGTSLQLPLTGNYNRKPENPSSTIRQLPTFCIRVHNNKRFEKLLLMSTITYSWAVYCVSCMCIIVLR